MPFSTAMATIAIVTSTPPLTDGGHLVLARSLERALREAGHRVGIVTTPSNRFGRQGAAYLANWLTDVGLTGSGQRVDQVISMRYPSYAVRHPAHACWLVHTMREYYDLWEDFSAHLSPMARLKERIRRRMVHTADTYCLRHHVERLFTISGAVSDRLKTWNGLDSQPLHPPPPQRAYRCDGYGDYLFFASRLTPLKRADLILRAMAQPAAVAARCVIGGDGEDRARLERLGSDLGVSDRVRFTGTLSDDELVAHLGACRAVVFPPHQEDYGFVTVEAFAAAKAVITCADSGGPLEFVRTGENGWVVPPTPDALAAAMAEAMDDAQGAERRGAQALKDVTALSWERVVQSLVFV